MNSADWISLTPWADSFDLSQTQLGDTQGKQHSHVYQLGISRVSGAIPWGRYIGT